MLGERAGVTVSQGDPLFSSGMIFPKSGRSCRPRSSVRIGVVLNVAVVGNSGLVHQVAGKHGRQLQLANVVGVVRVDRRSGIAVAGGDEAVEALVLRVARGEELF